MCSPGFAVLRVVDKAECVKRECSKVGVPLAGGVVQMCVR